jgi:hypothetical protein
VPEPRSDHEQVVAVVPVGLLAVDDPDEVLAGARVAAVVTSKSFPLQDARQELGERLGGRRSGRRIDDGGRLLGGWPRRARRHGGGERGVRFNASPPG